MNRTDTILLALGALLLLSNVMQIVLLRSRRLVGPRGARGIVGPAGPVGAMGPAGANGCAHTAPDGTTPRFVK